MISTTKRETHLLHILRLQAISPDNLVSGNTYVYIYYNLYIIIQTVNGIYPFLELKSTVQHLMIWHLIAYRLHG